MELLFRIETDRWQLTWNTRARESAKSQSQLGTIKIKPNRGDLTFGPGTYRAFPAAEPWDPRTDYQGPRLFEATDYNILLQGIDSANVELRHRDPSILTGVTRAKSHTTVYGTINFRGHVGSSTFSVWVDGQLELTFEVEVSPSKLDYKADYSRLVSEVQSQRTALALEYLRPTRHAGAARDETSTSLEWLVMLDNHIGLLEHAFRLIQRQPLQGIVRKTTLVRADRIRRVGPQARKAMLRATHRSSAVDFEGRLRVPNRLPEETAQLTNDTPEHRWLSSKLKEVRRKLAVLREEPIERNESPARGAAIRSELQALDERVAVLQRSEFCAAARPRHVRDLPSLQLLAAPGYRDAHRLLTELGKALQLASGDLSVSLKELYVLYEYWCFITLGRILAEELDQPFPSEALDVREEGLRVRLEVKNEKQVVFAVPDGRTVRLYYKPRLGGDVYLVAQEPDFLITFESSGWPQIAFVLDAKYRLDQSPEYVKRYGYPGPPEEALNVLHRYRDAILHESFVADQAGVQAMRTVVEAAALYPAPALSEAQYLDSRLWGSFDRIGIGALPFLPANTEHVRHWIRGALRRGGWSLSKRAMTYAIHERAEEMRRRSTEPVMVGVLRDKNSEEHLQWILQTGLYYTPLHKDASLQFAAKAIAIYSPPPLRTPGAVTHVGLVKRVEVVARSAIPTPWSSTKPQRMNVVYHLDDVKTLELIENRSSTGRGSRVSSPRWTSMLALERARTLPELFLQVEAEWQLYEDLIASGIEFELQPGRPSASQGNHGRAEFLTKYGKIVYRGARGFALQSMGSETRWLATCGSVLAHLRESEANV